jgi:hypothetical protein
MASTNHEANLSAVGSLIAGSHDDLLTFISDASF